MSPTQCLAEHKSALQPTHPTERIRMLLILSLFHSPNPLVTHFLMWRERGRRGDPLPKARPVISQAEAAPATIQFPPIRSVCSFSKAPWGVAELGPSGLAMRQEGARRTAQTRHHHGWRCIHHRHRPGPKSLLGWKCVGAAGSQRTRPAFECLWRSRHWKMPNEPSLACDQPIKIK